MVIQNAEEVNVINHTQRLPSGSLSPDFATASGIDAASLLITSCLGTPTLPAYQLSKELPQPSNILPIRVSCFLFDHRLKVASASQTSKPQGKQFSLGNENLNISKFTM